MRGCATLQNTQLEWCEEHGLDKASAFTAIATSSTKFKCFNIGCFKFIDSLGLMPASLSQLIDKIGGECPIVEANNMGKKSKGVFPYEWFDSEEKLDQPLPTDREAYFSKLSNSYTATQLHSLRSTKLHVPYHQGVHAVLSEEGCTGACGCIPNVQNEHA